MESIFTPLIPLQFFEDLRDEADANIKVYFYVKAGLELMLVMAYVSMIVKDSKRTRDIVYRGYFLYVIVVTLLSLFMAFFPSGASKQLDREAISKYCEELSETDLSYFDDVDDCLQKASLNFRRNELIFINLQFFLNLHFIHVIWSHLKNADLSRSQGGCQPDLRTQNIQMQQVARQSLNAI